MKKTGKNIACTMLALLMLLALAQPPYGMTALAAEGEHQHDEACGYSAGAPCSHVHNEDCGFAQGIGGTPCAFAHEHDEACGYSAEAPEGCTFDPASHVHDEACGYAGDIPDTPCGHTHDEVCGYAEVMPCNFQPEGPGSELTFTDSAAYDIPASTVGTAIAPILVSGGVAGGTPPYTFSATGLPDGISISAAGVLSGTPTTAAAAGTATITVTDGDTAQASITIDYGAIAPLAVNGTFETGGLQYTVLTNTPTRTAAVTGWGAGGPQSTLTIPATANDGTDDYAVTEIGAAAFQNGTSATTLDMAGATKLTKIGIDAFRGCGFNAARLPAQITAVPEGLFANCPNLAAVEFSPNLASIGNSAFQNTALAGMLDLSAYASLTSIGDQAFYGCAALTEVRFPAGLASIGYIAFAANSTSNISVLRFLGSAAPTLGATPFVNLPATGTLYYPAGGTGYTQGAFGTPDLDNWTFTPFDGTLTFTHSAAFDIPASKVGTAIAPIGVASGAWSGTPPYTFSATGLPDGITISAAGVLSGTPTTAGAAGAATLTVTDSATPSAGTDSITINYGAIAPLAVGDTFEAGGLLYKVLSLAPNTAALVGWGAGGAQSTLTIPSTAAIGPQTFGVTEIGAAAFIDETSSTALDMAGATNLKVIGAEAFRGWSALYCDGLDLSGLTSLTTIGDFAFDGCRGLSGALNLSGLTGLATIGEFAFRECSFTGALGLSGLTALTAIGRSAFMECRGITSVDFSGTASLPAIGENTFSGCWGLAGTLDLSVLTGLQTIGLLAFNGCRNIAEVRLPAGLSSIAGSAFGTCTSLSVLRFYGTAAPAVATNSFRRVPATGTVYYPTGGTGYLKGTFGAPDLDNWTFIAFDPADTAKPAVAAVSPASGATGAALAGNIAITFSKAMAQDAIFGIVTLTGGSGTVNAPGTWSADGKTFTIAYSGLANGRGYTIGIAGFQDIAGNTMAAATSSFTTVAAPSLTVGPMTDDTTTEGAPYSKSVPATYQNGAGTLAFSTASAPMIMLKSEPFLSILPGRHCCPAMCFAGAVVLGSP